MKWGVSRHGAWCHVTTRQNGWIRHDVPGHVIMFCYFAIDDLQIGLREHVRMEPHICQYSNVHVLRL
jgi:hypothetical protein